MSKEGLKQLWFTLDNSNVPERKEIIVQTDYGHVEILSDGPGGYSSFKTNQGDNCIQYAKDRISSKDGYATNIGYTNYSEYKLIIKKR
tara:strand:+ start:280 stop:543 length:264 start_codon:yes stop_codon:yes gene_type:complete